MPDSAPLPLVSDNQPNTALLPPKTIEVPLVKSPQKSDIKKPFDAMIMDMMMTQGE